MAQKTPKEWLEALPDNTCSVRLRCGTGKNLPTVGVVALESAKLAGKSADHVPARVETLEELVERSEEILADSGYPAENPRFRLHAYGPKGGELRSLQGTASSSSAPEADRPMWAVVDRLTTGLLASAAENRKALSILSETLSHRESVMSEALEAAMEFRMHMQDAQLHQAVAEMSIPEDAPEEEGGMSGAATALLEQVAARFMGAPPEIDADTLRAILASDPGILDSLVSDDDLVGQVFAAYQVKRAKTPEDGPPSAAETHDAPVVVDIESPD